MRKQWALTKRSFILNLTYRSELVLWFVLDILPIIILLIVWISIYAGSSELRGYQLGEIVQYYLLVSVISNLTSHHFEQYRVKQIREGAIDYYLIRPLSYLSELAFTALGNKAVFVFISLSLSAIIFFGLSFFFPLGTLTLTFSSVLQFLVLLIAAYLIEFYIALLIVLLGFWFENAEGFEHFKWFTVSLFSGYMIPLAFMPDWMARTTELLPFKFIAAIPIGVIQNTYTMQLGDWLYLTLTILGMAGATHLIWQQAKKRYTSSGG